MERPGPGAPAVPPVPPERQRDPAGLSTGASLVRNTILWANTGGPDSASSATFVHSIVPFPTIGSTNLSIDPLFRDPAGGDWRLLQASPARNSGTNVDPLLLSHDIEGDPRPFEGVVDRGADEWASRLRFDQPAPGALTAVALENVLPGNQYLNLFSLTPCVPGATPVPMIGLCSSIPDLVAQAVLPLGTEPFRVVANAPSMTLGPYPVPVGLSLEAVLIDVTGAVFDPTRVSAVARIDVQ